LIGRAENVEVKKGILGGWVYPARIVQGKKKIKLNPALFSQKQIHWLFATIRSSSGKES
jgi:hypothetical protein